MPEPIELCLNWRTVNHIFDPQKYMVWCKYLHLFLFPTLEGIFGNALEGFFYVNAFFGRSFKVWDISFWSTPSSCLFLWNLKYSEKQKISVYYPLKVERENDIILKLRKYLQLYCFHHQHQLYFLKQRRENFLDRKGLPADRYAKASKEVHCFFFFFVHLFNLW